MAHPADPKRNFVRPGQQAGYFASVEVLLVQIKAGPDATLIDAMSKAAFEEWRQIIGFPTAWERAEAADTDSIRVGMFRALAAARAHARAKKEKA